jgi:hypothetical protein
MPFDRIDLVSALDLFSWYLPGLLVAAGCSLLFLFRPKLAMFGWCGIAAILAGLMAMYFVAIFSHPLCEVVRLWIHFLSRAGLRDQLPLLTPLILQLGLSTPVIAAMVVGAFAVIRPPFGLRESCRAI